jgi:hypothetical protein
VPFTARQLGEVPAYDDASHDSVYDVELPYRRLGRCRMSATVGVDVGTGLKQVAAALSIYETRNGRAATAAQLLGAGVDLSSHDGPAKTTPASVHDPDEQRYLRRDALAAQVCLDGEPTGVRQMVGNGLLVERSEQRRQVAAVDLAGRPPQRVRSRLALTVTSGGYSACSASRCW